MPHYQGSEKVQLSLNDEVRHTSMIPTRLSDHQRLEESKRTSQYHGFLFGIGKAPDGLAQPTNQRYGLYQWFIFVQGRAYTRTDKRIIAAYCSKNPIFNRPGSINRIKTGRGSQVCPSDLLAPDPNALKHLRRVQPYSSSFYTGKEGWISSAWKMHLSIVSIRILSVESACVRCRDGIAEQCPSYGRSSC